MNAHRRIRRLNWKAIGATAAALVLLAGVGFGVSFFMRDRVRDEALAQVEKLVSEKNRPLALRHLNQYLATHPNDTEVLKVQAKLLYEAAQDLDQWAAAANANERMLRLDPNGPDSDELRVRLADLYIRQSDELLAYNAADRLKRLGGARVAQELMYGPAESLLEEVTRGDKAEKAPAKAFRLLGMAKEGRLSVRGAASRVGPTSSPAPSGESSRGDLDRTLIDQIERAYQMALEKDPKDKTSAIRLALFQREHGNRTTEADLIIQQMLENDPDSSESHLIARRYYARTNQPEKARDELRKAVQLSKGDDFQTQLEYALSLIQDQKPEEARKALEALPKDRWYRPEPWRLLGQTYILEGNVDEAMRTWKKGLLETQEPDIEMMWELANRHIERGQLDEAQPLIDRLRKFDSGWMASLGNVLQALAYEKAGRFEEALALYDKAQSLTLDRFLGTVLLGMGRCAEALGDSTAAEKHYTEGLQVSPTSPDLRVALANLRLKQGKVEEATRLLRATADLADRPELLEALARALLAEQAMKPPASRNWAPFDETVGRLAADSAEAAVLRVQKLVVDGDWKAAAAASADGCQKFPKAANLWTLRSEALQRLGDTTEALRVLEEASKPANAGDRYQFRIDRARMLNALGRGREALDVLSYSLVDLPVDQRAQLLEAKGRLLAARGSLTEARAAFADWARIQPGVPGPLLAQLELAITVGDNRTALACLKALEPPNFKEPTGKDQRWPFLYGLARVDYLTRMPQAGKDRIAEARKITERMATKDYPQDARVALLHGRVLQLSGDEAGAIAQYKLAARAGLQDAIAPLVALLVRAGRYSEISSLQKAGAPFEPASPLRLAAELALRKGDRQQAAAFVAEALRLFPPSEALSTWRLAMLDRLGQPADVEKGLEEQIARDPERIAVWIALMRYQAAQGQKDRALATMKRLIDRSKPEDQLLVQAQCLEAIGDQEGAEKAYAQLMASRPGDTEAVLAAARFYEQSQRPQQAEALLRQYLAKDPGNRPASRLLALSLSGLPDLSEASWNEAMQLLGPTNDPALQTPEDRLTRGIVLARHPDPARRREAIPVLEALVEDQPATQVLATAAREALVKLYLADQNPERAAEVAAVTATSSLNLNAIALYVETLLQAKNWDEAERQINRLAMLVPRDPALADLRLRLVEGRAGPEGAANALAQAIRDRSGQPDEFTFAQRAIRRILGLLPQGDPTAENLASEQAARDPKTSWLLAQVLAASKKYEQAVAAARLPATDGEFDQAFEAARALLTVAQEEGPTGPHASAVDELITRASDRFPDKSGLRAIVGMLRHLQGRYDDEIRIYREILASDPDNALYNNNLAWALCECSQKPEEALGFIDTAIRALGRQPDLLDTRGVILTRLGRYPEAIEDLKEAVREMTTPSPLFLFHLARAYKLANQNDLARSTLSQARQLGLTPETVEPFERPDLEALGKL